MDLAYYDRGEKILASTGIGNLIGTLVNINGKYVARFLGIPYAKQPTGDRRFKPLEPLDCFVATESKPYDATKPGNAAIQRTDLAQSTLFKTSEECIFLNIFIPLDCKNPGSQIKLGHTEGIEPKPVLFHLHGGAFILGSGSAAQYDLSNFAALHNSIGVSINYRLNVFGFLSFPPAIEENLGLRDQQIALKWVHENIGSFGGDPSRVTLYGCSAGGASVQYHCLNANSSQYFQNAIISSGVLTTRWSVQTKAVHRKCLKDALQFLGYRAPLDSENVLTFLQSLPVERFEDLLHDNLEWDFQFHPVESEDLNISKLDSCSLSRKPILVGVTAEEGTLIPDTFFPREDMSRQTRIRKAFGLGAAEYLFYQPARKFCRQLTSLPGLPYPLYCCVFDYNCQTRAPMFPESTFLKRYGKYHSLDTMFFLGHFSLGSYSVPAANDLDRFVNNVLAEVVDQFLYAQGDNANIELPVYEEKTRKFVRITENGIKVAQGKRFPGKISLLGCIQALAAYELLRAFPGKL